MVVGIPTTKYSCPLYAAAWASDDVLLLAGGGGKKTSGIKNKVMAVKTGSEGSLQEEIASYLSGESEFDVPYRLAIHSSGKLGVVSMAGVGGCRCLEIAQGQQHTSDEGTVHGAVTIAHDEDRTASLQALAPGVGTNCVCFGGGDECKLFLGLEDGRVLVADFPECKLLQSSFSTVEGEVKPDDRGLKDMDVSPVSSGPMMVTTSDGGECKVWCWQDGCRLAKLGVPASLKAGRGFSCCRFAVESDSMFGSANTLYTVINAGGAGYVQAWVWGPGRAATLPEALKEGWSNVKLSRQRNVAQEPITCMEMSPTGQWIAAGTSEGDIVICQAGSLAVARRLKQAHLVFCTGLAWAPDGQRVVSISGDASACMVQAPSPPGLLQRPEVQLVLAMLALILAILAQKILAVMPTVP